MARSNTPPIIDRKPDKSSRGGVIQKHLLMRLAYKNLFFKKLRTGLTVMGVVIGIGSIVFLLSFGYGLQDLVSKQVIGSNSVQTIDVTSPKSKVLKLNQTTGDQIKAMANVKQLGKSYSTAGKVKSGSSQTESVVFAADKNYIDLSNLTFNSGKSFGDGSLAEVMLSNTLVKALGLEQSDKSIGKIVSVSFEATTDAGQKHTTTKDLKISGIYQSESRAELFISNKLLENEGVGNANQFKVVAENKDAVTTIRNSVNSMGFTTSSPLDTLDQINQVFTLLHFILLGFGGIGMVIAILGMFNTLTISLLERTREIGLMISLGARKQDIRRLFIVEALLLSILGGFVGVVGACTLGLIGNLVLNSYAHHNGVTGHISAFSFSPTLILTTLALSGALGLAVVYFPARRAAQTNPIDALHND